MKKPKRIVNKKLLGALIGHAGTSYQDLANRMNPPVSRPLISQIMLAETCNERLMTQVTEILRPAFEDLTHEVLHVDRNSLLDHLFPLVQFVEDGGTRE
ncbi:hypothetical protein ES708_24878 [subsurface metagenome]